MRTLLIRWAILTLGIAAAAWLFDGVEVTGGFWGYVWVAAVLGLVNAVIRPVLILLTLPITLVTLGLFILVINAITLGITDWLSDTIAIDGFLTTLLAAAVISLVSWAVSGIQGSSFKR
ncbi:MAG: phage holin family protein [Acidimicrobiales bacterium]|nr:phage holin family protein [Acidimicrobiales bacterium]